MFCNHVDVDWTRAKRHCPRECWHNTSTLHHRQTLYTSPILRWTCSFLCDSALVIDHDCDVLNTHVIADQDNNRITHCLRIGRQTNRTLNYSMTRESVASRRSWVSLWSKRWRILGTGLVSVAAWCAELLTCSPGETPTSCLLLTGSVYCVRTPCTTSTAHTVGPQISNQQAREQKMASRTRVSVDGSVRSVSNAKRSNWLRQWQHATHREDGRTMFWLPHEESLQEEIGRICLGEIQRFREQGLSNWMPESNGGFARCAKETTEMQRRVFLHKDTREGQHHGWCRSACQKEQSQAWRTSSASMSWHCRASHMDLGKGLSHSLDARTQSSCLVTKRKDAFGMMPAVAGGTAQCKGAVRFRVPCWGESTRRLPHEKIHHGVCLRKLIGLALERNFPKRLLYIALRACLSDRIFLAGEMMAQTIQPTNGILAGCSLRNGFARVVLNNILERVNNTLPVQLPHQQKCSFPHQQKHASSWMISRPCWWQTAKMMSFTTICSVTLEQREELEEGRPILSKSQSRIVSNHNGLAHRVHTILKVIVLHLPVADAARDLGVDAAGGGRRRRVGAGKPRSGHALDHGHLALRRLWGGTTRLVTHRFETLPQCGRRMLGCGWLSDSTPHRPQQHISSVCALWHAHARSFTQWFFLRGSRAPDWSFVYGASFVCVERMSSVATVISIHRVSEWTHSRTPQPPSTLTTPSTSTTTRSQSEVTATRQRTPA